MNRYRATTPDAVVVFGEGVLDLDLSATTEGDWLARGLLELVPRRYRALSANFRVRRGELFDDTFLVEVEAALIRGGHIERVESPDKPPAKKGK